MGAGEIWFAGCESGPDPGIRETVDATGRAKRGNVQLLSPEQMHDDGVGALEA